MICILKHHGIKGMRWGVRKGPPYPIEDKILRKGTKLNSVSIIPDSNAYKNTRRPFYTYNPKDKHDSKIYKGPFVMYLSYINKGAKHVYEHQYETVKDLKMPTKKERVDEFINVYSKNKKITTKDLQRVQKLMQLNNVGSNQARKIDLKKVDLNNKKDVKATYEIFNHAMEAGHLFKSTRAYTKIMSKKYEAMVDDNNQGLYNDAHDPIIIFRADQALKTIGKARVISPNEATGNYQDLYKELKKQGKKIKL